MSVLIVDDSVDERLLLKTFLTAAGYAELITAESAGEAFEHLRLDDQNGVEVGVDLILLDITMPKMDGIEACRRIKARSLSEKQCSKRYASLVECKDANYSTTKSRLL